jgi:hypothetical protein
MILHGRPGVGKTTFIKYFFSFLAGERAVYCKDKAVLEDQSFWLEMTEMSVPLVLDDISFNLDNKSVAVSNLLSYTDGIFGRGSKVIITTNQEINEVAPAMIRPGRCFDFILLEELDAQEALKLWTELFQLDEVDFYNRFAKEKRVSQASLMSAVEDLSYRNVNRGYLKNKPWTPIEQRLDKLKIFVPGAGKKEVGFGVK